MPDNQLSKPERQTLNELETTISRGIRAFMEVGAALRTIRDNRLYRAKASTFEDYCQIYWNFSRQYANQTIRSYQTVLQLGEWQPIGFQNHQWNDAQAKQLSLIPEAKRKKVMALLMESGKPITAEAIRSAWCKVNGTFQKQMEKKRRQEWLKDFDKSYEQYGDTEEEAKRSIYAQEMESIPQAAEATTFDYDQIKEQDTAAANAWTNKSPVYCDGYDDPQELDRIKGLTESEVMELMTSKLGIIFNYLTSTRYQGNQKKILQSYLMRTFAMLYVMRLDLLNADYPGNTLEKIAKSLNISAQRFEWYVRSFCDLTGMKNPHQKSNETRKRMSAAHSKESFVSTP